MLDASQKIYAARTALMAARALIAASEALADGVPGASDWAEAALASARKLPVNPCHDRERETLDLVRDFEDK